MLRHFAGEKLVLCNALSNCLDDPEERVLMSELISALTSPVVVLRRHAGPQHHSLCTYPLHEERQRQCSNSVVSYGHVYPQYNRNKGFHLS